MADLPTEQEFMQGQDTRASRSTEGSALAKGLTQIKHDVSVIPTAACCDSDSVQCFAVHCLRDAEVEESLSGPSELQDGIDSTGREVLGSKQWTVRCSRYQQFVLVCSVQNGRALLHFERGLERRLKGSP